MGQVCPHGDDSPQSCPPCQTASTGRLVTADPPSRVFTARHDGVCRGCGFDVRPGEPVRYQGDRLVHARCGR